MSNKRKRPVEDTNIGSDDVAARESETKQGLRDILSLQMPSPLENQFRKGLLAASAVAVVTIALLICFGIIQLVIGFAIAGYIVYKSIMIKVDYSRGSINEVAVICVSAKYNMATRSVKVTFRDDDRQSDDDDITPSYYSFTVPDRIGVVAMTTGRRSLLRRNDNSNVTGFDPNHVYVIYFNPRNMQNLIAYEEL